MPGEEFELLNGGALKIQNFEEEKDTFFADVLGKQFFFYFLFSDLVQLIHSDEQGRFLLLASCEFCQAGKDIAVIELDGIVRYIQFRKNFPDHQNDLRFTDQRTGADHIGIALIKFAVAPFLRPVGTPYRLDLVTLERKCNIMAGY